MIERGVVRSLLSSTINEGVNFYLNGDLKKFVHMNTLVVTR
jgi:hypothetical protein